jgi:membrane fusion protein (multidrug efflux system)
MTAAREDGPRHILRTVFVGIAFVVVVVVLMLWLAGTFHRKIERSQQAGGHEAAPVRPVGANVQIVTVEKIRVPQTEAAVGSVRAVHETAVASKILAKVVAVNVTAGEVVHAGEVLVRLDDADLKARLEQAEATVASAKATRDQAKIEFDRVQKLYAQGQAAQIEFDRTQTALRSAEAELDRAQQAQKEAQTILGYATIRSPINGKVIDKQIEAGDTAQPGQVLLTLYDPTRMQLVARVRESLAHRLKVGEPVNVHIGAIKETCTGTVSEIVPEAQTASRSFTVKVTGPCPDGVYSGMFGRIAIPLGERDVLVVPQSAIRHVGQLNLVDVVEEESGEKVLRRRAVELGKSYGDQIQVLAGLREGERVAIPANG